MGQVIKDDGGTGQFRNITLSVDAMQALESHRIDFVWVYEGWEVIRAQRQGVKLNIFPITSYGIPDYYTPNLIASPTEIKQKPELLRKFMLATSCGYEYTRTHPHQAAQMLLDSPEVPAGTFPDPGIGPRQPGLSQSSLCRSRSSMGFTRCSRLARLSTIHHGIGRSSRC